MSKVANVEKDSGPEKLFFELASESRLQILRELQGENLKMQEIAHRLDVTATEAFRQLERLGNSLLVKRQPDGAYALSEYGKLVLQATGTIEFISKYKDYFSAHDLMILPSTFLNRLNELSKAELEMDTIAMLNKGTQAFSEAEQYAYGMGEGTVPGEMGAVMGQRLQSGVQVKMIISEERVPSSGVLLPKNLELRALDYLPALIAITEKTAGVCFRQIGGRMDYAGFSGTEAAFHGWVKDLFLYYWEKAKRF